MNFEIVSVFKLPRTVRRALAAVSSIFAVLGSSGCNQNTVPATLRSLQGSGDVSFVCVGSDGKGRDLTSCPDFENRGNRMLALVTQSISGEVALIQLAGKGTAGVVDVDPSTPGYNFLRIGDSPVDIVSTPDGVASFVGVAELDKPGIYALPTTCVGPPKTADAGTDSGKETARDITSWPACALPAAPGAMAILIDPPRPDGRVRKSCTGELEDGAPPPSALRAECGADLTSSANLTQRGRRKLAVSLPDLGEIAIIDAQSLLDREPGSFEACPIDGFLPLRVDLPPEGVDQAPGDLGGTGGSTCLDFHHASPPGPFTPRPSGFALVDHDLYVGDQGAPVIHDIDISDPCHPVEKPLPLLPVSLEHPERVITTTRVAGSPPTRDGHRFLYAVDEMDQPGASVMVFDITPGASSRTPMIRPGAARMPLEPPDRIGFAPAARDVAFALHDVPISDATGNAVVGTSCDPDPKAPTDSPGAQYRPSSSLATGAGPSKLRGIFGFVMLTNGQIGVIDVEDFDAPCRRPTATNPHPIEDFRGCRNDPPGISSYTLDGIPTVSNEASCRVVEPHRVRARDYAITNDAQGVRAPSLRTFPNLTSLTGGLVTDQSEAGRKQPKLLPVDFPNPDPAPGAAPLFAQVYIGATLFSSDPKASNHVDTDPGKAERGAVALPLNSPRAYPAQEDVSVIYEGPLFGPRSSGLLRFGTGGDNQVIDTSGAFCTSGVEDVELARERGKEQFPSLSAAALETFAHEHADYVQIVDDFLPSDDVYWTQGAGASCGGKGRDACVQTFGNIDAPALLTTRDLTIVKAWENRLSVAPRNLKAADQPARLALLSCCFPSAVHYTVRASLEWVLSGSASGFRHQIMASPTSECVRDCNPRKRYFAGRAFEISSNPSACGSGCPVGARVSGTDVVCNTYASGSASSSGALSGCIFDGLTARFAIYRGQQPSQRDMAFTWQALGGFRSLTLDLVSQSTSVLPQSLQFLPELNQLVVIDGESLGLTLLSLDTLGVVTPSPFF